MEVFGVQTCNEIKLDDTADNRAVAQAVIGEDFELRYERGKLVLSAEEVASYFEKRAKRQLKGQGEAAVTAAAPVSDDVRAQVRDVARVQAQLKQQFDARKTGPLEHWAYVDSQIDKGLVDIAVELLGEELGASWRLVCPSVPNSAKKWAVMFTQCK